jgi:hypothetical protein
MSRPPRRLRRSCTHDGADLLRDALGQFICDICGQPCEDEPPDASASRQAATPYKTSHNRSAALARREQCL